MIRMDYKKIRSVKKTLPVNTILPYCRVYPAFLLCIIAVLLLASGCVRAPQPGQPGGPAPAVVEIWHSLQGAETEALQAQAEWIMAKHSAVLVKLKYVPEANFVNFSWLAEAGGKGPDIFITSRETICQLYERGMLAKPAYLDQGAYPAALAAFQSEGTAFASPWLTDVPLLYYRPDLARAPLNLDDLFGNRGGVSLTAADMFSLAVWWSAPGSKIENSGPPVLTDSGNLEFLQQLLRRQESGSLRIDASASGTFAAGQSFYMIAGAGHAKSLSESGVPWRSMSLSDLVGGQGQPLLCATLGIANSTIKTTEILLPAIRLVEKELLALETQAAMALAGNRLPVNTGYYLLPEAAEGVYPQAAAALENAWVLEGTAREWKVFPWLEKAWGKALAGEMTPEEALAYAQEEAQKDLAPK